MGERNKKLETRTGKKKETIGDRKTKRGTGRQKQGREEEHRQENGREEQGREDWEKGKMERGTRKRYRGVKKMREIGEGGEQEDG